MVKKSKENQITMDRLAIMVAKGFESQDKRFDKIDRRFEQVDQRFEQVDQRFEQVDQRFEQVDQHFAHIDATLISIRGDVEGIQRDMIYKDEMEDLMARVKYVEMKLGIESGK